LCVALSVAKARQSAKRHAVGLSSFHIVARIKSKGLATGPSVRASSRQLATRQHALWRASLETGRQDESATPRRLWLAIRRKCDNDIGCVVAIDKIRKYFIEISIQ
jgi:hypothetical protein